MLGNLYNYCAEVGDLFISIVPYSYQMSLRYNDSWDR